MDNNPLDSHALTLYCSLAIREEMNLQVTCYLLPDKRKRDNVSFFLIITASCMLQ